MSSLFTFPRITSMIRHILPESWQIPVKFWVNLIQHRLEPELALLPYLLHKGELTLDIGANRGIYTYKLRRLGVAVHAFEPNPSCASLLCAWGKNDTELTVHNIALSDCLGQAELQIPIDSAGIEHDASASLIPHQFPTSRAIAVTLRTLDSYEFAKISLIKIDVEGAELDVLIGSKSTLERDKPVLLIEIERRHSNRSFASVFEMLKDKGYHCFFFDNNVLYPFDRFDLERHQCLENFGSNRGRYVNNFLFLDRSRLDAGSYDRLFKRWSIR